MRATYTINLKSKDVKGIRRYIENYLSTDEAKDIINNNKSIKDDIKFAIINPGNEDYTFITAVYPFLINDPMAQNLSRVFDCLCLYMQCEDYVFFSVELFESGESLSKVSREEVLLNEGVDEDGMYFAHAENKYFSNKFNIDIFCDKLNINEAAKKKIAEAVKEESTLVIDRIEESLKFSVYGDIEYVLYLCDKGYLQKNQVEFIS